MLIWVRFFIPVRRSPKTAENPLSNWEFLSTPVRGVGASVVGVGGVGGFVA